MRKIEELDAYRWNSVLHRASVWGMCLVTSCWQSAVPHCGLTGFKKLALFAFCGILVGGWDGCESDGFWSSQEHLSCYGCSKAEAVAVFLLPLREQTWIAILFQDAPSGSSAGPACWNFNAQAVPRKAATGGGIEAVSLSHRRLGTPYASWGPFRSPNFVRQGPTSFTNGYRLIWSRFNFL